MDTSAVDETKPIENKPPVINPPLEPSPVELPSIPPSATASGPDADIRIHLPSAGPTEMPAVPAPPTAFELDRQTVERLTKGRSQIVAELSKVIVGQHDVIDQILIALLSGGHCLITGAPGLAKTLLVKSIARIFHLKFQRIQFTPDLMPADLY
jgi:hypothetical protein